MSPHLRAIYHLYDLYGPEMLQTDEDETFAPPADNLVRETRLNPQLAHPLSLLEQWDGTLLLKQEVYLPLYHNDLPSLEKALKKIEAHPQRDHHATLSRMCLVYRAVDHHLFLYRGETHIDMGKGSRAILKRLIDALKLQQVSPAIEHLE
jgi:hypothetical protein